MSLFTCSVILLLNVWHGRRSGAIIHVDKELDQVQKAMQILKALEPRCVMLLRAAHGVQTIDHVVFYV